MLKKLLENLSSVHLAPLHQRLRPQSLEEYVGQGHVRDEKRLLEKILALPDMPPLFLLGPPGVGKTSFARMIGRKKGYRYVEVNAARENFEDLRTKLAEAVELYRTAGQRTIFFLDEMDRVPLEEQERFLPHIGKGGPILLIAATPRAPEKILTPELLKRFYYLILKKHTDNDLQTILERTLKDRERGLGHRTIVLDDACKRHLILVSKGNARDMLRMLSWALSHIMLKPSVSQQPKGTPGVFVINKTLIDIVAERMRIRKEKQKKILLERETKRNKPPISQATSQSSPVSPPAKK